MPSSKATKSKKAQAKELDSQPLLTSPALYRNRELSWLEFNRRVQEEALDERNPLLERVKFLSISSTNLDEFFAVRVAGIKEQQLSGLGSLTADGLTPAEQLSAIRASAVDMSVRQRCCWHEDLQPLLRRQGIAFEPFDTLSASEQAFLSDYFKRQIYPVLTPQAVDAGHPFPHISSLSLNMLIVVEDARGQHVARMKIPPVLPRFIEIPPSTAHGGDDHRQYRFVLLEEVIEANLGSLFPGKRVTSAYMFRITRDADLEFRDAANESLIKTVEDELERRHFGFVVRLTVEPAMPDGWRIWLAERLDVPANDVYILDRPLGFADLMQLYALDRPELKDVPFTPRVPRVIVESPTIFDAISRQDLMLYHPYDSFAPVIDLIRQASADENVVAIKQTLYRIGSHSPIIEALLEARDDEKQVAVLVELKARFDEESNINWARALEKAGVHVAYGVTGLKTHCKVILVVRREGDKLRRYVHLGTGNYNPSTARIYTDLSMMTDDEDIASDVSDVFNLLTGYSSQTEYRKLLVAPVNMRSRTIELIENEARHGSDGCVTMKMNSLSDPRIIQALYRASQAGAKVDLIVRGICCLRPGMPGISDNIRVISIVGRFLEHPRIYYFAHGSPKGDECVYAGSADLMPRNLDYRVEILFPVEDPSLLKYVKTEILDAQLRDNTRASEMQANGRYVRLAPEKGEPVRDSHSLPGPRGPHVTLRAVPPILA
ncbi:polyphosphate kinase 1 [soil metagenome]